MSTQLRLYPRLMRAVLAAVALAMLLAWGIAVQLLSRSFEQRAARQIADTVDVLAEGLPLTPNLLQRLAVLQGSDFLVLDAQSDSKLSTLRQIPPELLQTLPEVTRVAAAATGSAPPLRYLSWDGNEHIVVVRTIHYPLDLRFRFVVGVSSLADTRRAVRRAALALALAMVAAIAILTLGLLRLVRSITRPLETLANVARRIAAGERQIASGIGGTDEIGTLAQAVDDLALRLGSYEAEHAARSRAAALGEMAARVAHEIRNPLTGMKMHLQLLAETAEPAQRDILERLLDELRRLELVVDSTLAVGRDPTLTLTRCDLRQIVDDVVQLMRPALAHRHVKTELELLAVDDTALDRDRIKQALLNLIRNAADALPQGGRVRISTGMDRAAREALITVDDSGPGLDPALRDFVFDVAATTKPMGLGVGLALSRDLVRAHGGDLRAESSALLGGARFVIALPLPPPVPVAEV